MAKILLCDDSATILMIFSKRLADAGHEVAGKGKDGNEGILLYAQIKPDLLLLDITMPNKDGRECLISVMKSDPKAKVIMVSAVQDPEVVKECLNSGAKAFISKEHLYNKDLFEQEVLTTIANVLKTA